VAARRGVDQSPGGLERGFGLLIFGLHSDFGFRVSDFGYQPLPHMNRAVLTRALEEIIWLAAVKSRSTMPSMAFEPSVGP
jgi:hypothetical protein